MVWRFPADVTRSEREVGDCLYDVITAYLKLVCCCSSQESMLVTYLVITGNISTNNNNKNLSSVIQRHGVR